MKLLDLRDIPDATEFAVDLCVIGAGPAGLTLAAEFVGHATRVLVVESGGHEPDLAASALNEVDNVGAARVQAQELMRTRALGGSSRIWSGRCTTLDDIDFQARSWVPHSGWPVTPQELAPFLDRAGSYLGLGPNVYGDRLWPKLGAKPPAPPLDGDLLTPRFWQFSRGRDAPWAPTRFGRDVLPRDAANIDVLLHATVTHIDTTENGSAAESIEVGVTGEAGERRVRVTARAFVLAGGGIENARLLLASNRVVKGGVGNGNDLVGRFLMDHPGSVIASIPPAAAHQVRNRFGRYWLNQPTGRHVYLHGVSLSPVVQEKEQLLNCAAFLEEYPAADDPWHAGRRLAAALKGDEPSEDEVELASFWRRDDASGPDPSRLQDALAVTRHAPAVIAGGYRMFRQHRPPLFKASQVDVYCLSEQVPDPDSRVTLSDRVDALGVPLSKICWKIDELERRSVQRLAELLGDEFGRVGYPRPAVAGWLNADVGWRDQLTDRAHPIGTTRMADDPKAGVVDRDGQVHGVAGLYVAGSSTFPTAGHANPTLMIVALAIRLADRLKSAAVR